MHLIAQHCTCSCVTDCGLQSDLAQHFGSAFWVLLAYVAHWCLPGYVRKKKEKKKAPKNSNVERKTKKQQGNIEKISKKIKLWWHTYVTVTMYWFSHFKAQWFRQHAGTKEHGLMMGHNRSGSQPDPMILNAQHPQVLKAMCANSWCPASQTQRLAHTARQQHPAWALRPHPNAFPDARCSSRIHPAHRRAFTPTPPLQSQSLLSLNFRALGWVP